MKENARQHYVPQFYLKLFSPKRGDDYIFCYNKEIKKSYRTKVNQVCFEIGFYEAANKPSKPIERAFDYAENKCSNLFQKVIKAQDLHVLDVKEFSHFVDFMVLFKLRTKKWRDIVNGSRKSWLDWINRQVPDWEVTLTTDNPAQFLHLFTIVKAHKLMLGVMLKNDWQLIINKSNVPFWTSDDPLILQLVKNDTRFNEPYYKHYFPLSPSLLVHSQPLIGNNVNVTKVIMLDENVVGKINRLIWNNAQRFVISKEDNFPT